LKHYGLEANKEKKGNNMLYVLVQNGSVINGPRAWNYRSFQNTLAEECNITSTLPMDYTDTAAITVTEGVVIYSATLNTAVEHNPATQYLHGPFWSFDGDVATGTFQVVDHPVEVVRSALKAQVAATRYAKETAGTKVTIQGAEVTVDTDRATRDQWATFQARGVDGVVYKFPTGWLTLTTADIAAIATAVHNHVQAQFAWEATTAAALDAAASAAELTAVNITGA
jgi:hypothetical protein